MVGEVVTSRLANRQVQDVAQEFADLITVENITGLGFVSVATASGVALAQQLVDLVVPRLPDDLGVSKDPRQARDFLFAGLLEGLWGFTVGVAAVKFVGTGRPFLFATAMGLSIGAFAIAGANLIEWGQRVFGMLSARLSEGDVLAEAAGGADRATTGHENSAAGAAEPVATDGGLDLAAVENPLPDARAGAGRTRPAAA